MASRMPVPARPGSPHADDASARRCLVVSSEFPPGPGGIGTQAHQLGVGLRNRGWQVRVLTNQDYASEAEVAAFNGAQPFEVVRLRRIAGPAFEAIYRSVELVRLLRSFRPHVLVASGSRAVMLAAARAAGRTIPLVAVGHGTEFGGRGWESRGVRWAFRRSAAIVSVSEFTRSQMLRLGVVPRKDRVIPNGADPARFRVLPRTETVRAKAELGLPEAPLVVTVGNVTARKGQDVVVRALDAVPDLHYAIVGMPTRGEEIRRLAAEIGVSERVHLLGRLDDARLVRLLNAADLFAMTSRHTADGDFEGYGIAVVEAALCALPAIVSDGSGLAEAIVHGQTGLCVPQEDPLATAAALRELLGDSARRREMGQAARRRAEAEQTWDCRMPAYDALLRDVARR